MISQKRLKAKAKKKAYVTRFSRAIRLHEIDIRILKHMLRTIQF